MFDYRKVIVRVIGIFLVNISEVVSQETTASMTCWSARRLGFARRKPGNPETRDGVTLKGG